MTTTLNTGGYPTLTAGVAIPWFEPAATDLQELCLDLRTSEVLNAAATECDKRQGDLGCTFELDARWPEVEGDEPEAIGAVSLHLGVVVTPEMDREAVLLQVAQACRSYANAITESLLDGLK